MGERPQAADIVATVGREYGLVFDSTFDDLSEAGGCLWRCVADGLSLSVRVRRGTMQPEWLWTCRPRPDGACFETTAALHDLPAETAGVILRSLNEGRYAVENTPSGRPALLIHGPGHNIVARIDF